MVKPARCVNANAPGGRLRAWWKALERGGVGADEAERAAFALREDFDIGNPHPGLALDLTLSRGAGRPRLKALSFSPDDERRVALWRAADGGWRVREAPTAVVAAPSRIDGVVEGSLYLSLVDAGVATPMAAQVVRWFGRDLDLSRDIESGDRFALVFEPAAGALLYAGVAPGGRVRQGEVVAFVGATGLATGPHLHYEVFAGGRRIDPQLARTTLAEGPDPARQAAFRAQKARIDALVGGG